MKHFSTIKEPGNIWSYNLRLWKLYIMFTYYLYIMQ